MCEFGTFLLGTSFPLQRGQGHETATILLRLLEYDVIILLYCHCFISIATILGGKIVAPKFTYSG